MSENTKKKKEKTEQQLLAANLPDARRFDPREAV